MPIRVVLGSRAVASCAVVVVAISATISMLEPVLPLYLSAKLGIGPARIGLIFGIGAVATTMLHPIYGRLADRWGGRRLMLIGLPLVACIMPLLTIAWSYPSTVAVFVLDSMCCRARHHALADLHGRSGLVRRASDRSASATACTTWRGVRGCSEGRRSPASSSSASGSRG